MIKSIDEITRKRNSILINKKICFIVQLTLDILTGINIAIAAVDITPNIRPAMDGPKVYISQDQVHIDINPPKTDSLGLSHNLYTEFNIDSRGVVFNNPTHATAQIILNEVIGIHPSYLQGMLRVNGPRADVIVSNPHGITCNGCGFLNVHQGILTTGKPYFDGNHLNGFHIKQGRIVVGQSGLIVYSHQDIDLSHIALIAGAVEINGNIRGQREQQETAIGKLHIIAGQNQVALTRDIDVDGLIEEINITRIDIDNGKKQVDNLPNNVQRAYIDIDKLGGMYAQKIFLMSTENGIGVNSAGFIHAVDHLFISTAHVQHQINGNMLSSHGDIVINAMSQKVPATFTNHGVIRAAKDIAIHTGIFNNSINKTYLDRFFLEGQYTISTIFSGHQLSVQMQQGENQGGKLSAGQFLKLMSLTGEKSTGNFTNQAAVQNIYFYQNDQGTQFCIVESCMKKKESNDFLFEKRTLQTLGGIITAPQIDITLNHFVNRGAVEKHYAGHRNILPDEYLGKQDIGGRVQADKRMNINVHTFENIGAVIKSDTLDIIANTFENLSAHVDGWNVNIQAKHLNHKTSIQRYENQMQYLDIAGKEGLINGYSVRFDIHGNLNVQGAWIRADENVHLNVEGKTSITSLVKEMKKIESKSSSYKEGNFLKSYAWSRYEQLGKIDQIALNAGIEVGKALTISSGRDIFLRGSVLESGSKIAIKSERGDIYIEPLYLNHAKNKYRYTKEAWHTLFIPGGRETALHEVELSLRHLNTEMVFGEQLDILASKGDVYIGDSDFVFLEKNAVEAPRTSGVLNITGKNIKTSHQQDIDQVQSNTRNTFFGIQYEGHSSIINAVSHTLKKLNIQGSCPTYVRATIMRGAQMVGDVSSLLFSDSIGGTIDGVFDKKEIAESIKHYSDGISQFYANDIHIKAIEGDVDLRGIEIRSLGEKGKLTIEAAHKVSLSEGESGTLWAVDSKNKTFALGDTASANIYMGSAGVGLRGAYNKKSSENTQAIASFTPMHISTNTLNFFSGGDMHLYGGKIIGEKITLNIGGTLKLQSAQESTQSYTHIGGWGGSFGIDANLHALFGLNNSLYLGDGYTVQHSALTAAQSGMVAKKISGMVGKNLWLIGANLTADSAIEKLKIGHIVQAESLFDTEVQEGFVIGGGMGARVDGVPVGYMKYDFPVLKKYKTEQRATIAGVSYEASGGVVGQLNTDANKLMQLIINDKIGAIKITGIFAFIPENEKPLGKARSHEYSVGKDVSDEEKNTPLQSTHYQALTPYQAVTYRVSLPEGTGFPTIRMTPMQIDGVYYIQIDHNYFPVRWDEDHATWYIFSQGYEYIKPRIPVEFNNGRWQVHNDVNSLSGGIRWLLGREYGKEKGMLLQLDHNELENVVKNKGESYFLRRVNRQSRHRLMARLNAIMYADMSHEQPKLDIPGYQENMQSKEIEGLLKEGKWSYPQKKLLEKYIKRAKSIEVIRKVLNDSKAMPMTFLQEEGQELHQFVRKIPLLKALEIADEIDGAKISQALVSAMVIALSKFRLKKGEITDLDSSYFYDFYGVKNFSKILDEIVYPRSSTGLVLEKNPELKNDSLKLEEAELLVDIQQTQKKQKLKEALIQLSDNYPLIKDDSNNYSLTTTEVIDLLSKNKASQFFSMNTSKHEMLLGLVVSENVIDGQSGSSYFFYDPYFGLYRFNSKVAMANALTQHFMTYRLAEAFYDANINKKGELLFNVFKINPELIKNIYISDISTQPM